MIKNNHFTNIILAIGILIDIYHNKVYKKYFVHLIMKLEVYLGYDMPNGMAHLTSGVPAHFSVKHFDDDMAILGAGISCMGGDFIYKPSNGQEVSSAHQLMRELLGLDIGSILSYDGFNIRGGPLAFRQLVGMMMNTNSPFYMSLSEMSSGGVFELIVCGVNPGVVSAIDARFVEFMSRTSEN